MRNTRSWATSAGWRRRAAILLCLVLLILGFNSTARIAGVAGLIQRIWVAVGWGWLALMAVHLLNTQPSSDA